MVSLSRPCVATLLLVALACGGCSRRPPAGESDTQSRKLRFFDLPNLDVRDVPLLMALDDLTAQGYTVENTRMASGALIADALARGDADVGLVNSQTMWMAIARGAPVRTIAEFTGTHHSPRRRERISGSCRDLDGKRLGVPTTGGFNPSLFRLHLQQELPGNRTSSLCYRRERRARRGAPRRRD